MVEFGASNNRRPRKLRCIYSYIYLIKFYIYRHTYRYIYDCNFPHDAACFAASALASWTLARWDVPWAKPLLAFESFQALLQNQETTSRCAAIQLVKPQIHLYKDDIRSTNSQGRKGCWHTASTDMSDVNARLNPQHTRQAPNENSQGSITCQHRPHFLHAFLLLIILFTEQKLSESTTKRSGLRLATWRNTSSFASSVLVPSSKARSP